MENQQFSYLFSLPLEIRQEIYLLASPPRLVRLQEQFDEDYEDFVQEIRTIPGRLNLDPSLTHFAFNWSIGLTPSRQNRLESFGFTSSKVRQSPWPPSAAPEIPEDWLEERPAMAWELARKSHFYSNAVIPSLLHVSKTIRSEMMNLGYRLFFRTRSSPPRTWFNVHHDILYVASLTRNWSSNHEFMSGGCDWDFGQLHPDEMKQVRRLALQDGSAYFSAPGPPPHPWTITTILRLFPKLSELLLLGWIEENRYGGKLLAPGTKRTGRGKQAPEDPWVISLTEELDCIFSLFPPDTIWHLGTWAGGPYGEMLTAHLKEHGHDAPYLKDASLSMQTELTAFMETIIAEHADTPLARWNIPRFTAAQAMPISWLERQQEERQRLREILGGLQHKWKLAKDSQADPGRYFSEGPCSERKFVSSHWAGLALHDCTYCEGDCGQWTYFQESKRWWIEEGPRM